VYTGFLREPTPLAKYQYLRQTQERNEVLFYALLERHLAEMLPIVYTPTVGDAVRQFSNIYQSARGLSFSPLNIDHAHDVAGNCLFDDIRMIVATDSSAILGIGDQGYGGVAISIGKLALYTTGGGVSPFRSVPVGLDVGTDRTDLIDEPNYLGVRKKRLKGQAYLDFMDRFVDAIKARYPKAIVQWEDLSKDAAFTVHDRYKSRLPSFNDDIQGTGAVTLAGVLSACKLRGDKLKDQRIVVYGAGAGGAGVAWEIVRGLMREGLTQEEAMRRMFVLDSKGLLMAERSMEDYKRPFAKVKEDVAGWDGSPASLLDVVRCSKATVLLGLSGQPGTFTEEVIRQMARNAERPVIFALSNPTSSCEALPTDILRWTAGKALVATGSPFDAVAYDGKTFEIGQGNNAFIFPGIGFGSILCEASAITDGMVTAAAVALAEYTEEKHLSKGLIYPPVEELRDVSARVAAHVIQQALKDGVARLDKIKALRGDMERTIHHVKRKQWQAKYLPFARGRGVAFSVPPEVDVRE
jgi:malate dehydrogenase (oxaloacetate-decarboxylating)